MLSVREPCALLSSPSPLYLQFLQLLEDHVVGHVVEEPVRGRQDDVSQLNVERGAVGSIRAGKRSRG